MDSIEISGGVTASFVYDPFRRRASKTISGTTTQFLYDGLNPVQELSSGGSPSVNANLLNGLGIDENVTRTDSSSNVSTFLADALGSTVGLVGSGGSIATNYSYEPFGNVTASGSSNGSKYQFTGRENDGTGLYFYRARYYSPTYQRFIGQDPIGFGGGDSNLYAYVENGPTNWADPFGLITVGQIGNIIYRETSGMSGDEIDTWRINIAHDIFNATDKYGDDNRPKTAPDTSPLNLNPDQQRLLNECHDSAQAAANQRNGGIDPTNGATHFNMRTTGGNYTWTSQKNGPNEQPSMISPAFDSTTKYSHIDIYP